MPSGAIAVPSHIALSASRLLSARNSDGRSPETMPAPRSAELEDAGAPAAQVGTTAGRVPAAAAVARTDSAFAAGGAAGGAGDPARRPPVGTRADGRVPAA